MKTGLFPLALTAFEEYMLCDDRPSHPMTNFFRLRLSGFLDKKKFEAAFSKTILRHPLLQAKVIRNRGQRPKWIRNPDRIPVVHWDAEANSRGFPNALPIDPKHEAGMRVWVIDQKKGHDVFLQVHHCCGDGHGMNRFIEDLLIGYALEIGQVEKGISLALQDLGRLHKRSAPESKIQILLKMAARPILVLDGIRRFLLRKPVTLFPSNTESTKTAQLITFPTPFLYALSAQETNELFSSAKLLGVTANDLLVRDLFLAIFSWRKNRAFDEKKKDWIRLAIPVDLRETNDSRMPMANSVSMAFLDRRSKDILDDDSLLLGIHRQMNRIKRRYLKYTFILSFDLARRLPGVLSKGVKSNKCRATSCLSNIGPVFTQTSLPHRDGQIVSGNVLLEALDYVLPLRPHTDASFCVYTYARRLRISIHFNPRVIPDREAKDLLDTYTQQIKNTIKSSAAGIGVLN